MFKNIYFNRDVNILVAERIMGFILNTPTDYKLGFVKLPIHRKHWIAIRWLQGKYMNLDSKLDSPSEIGDQNCLLEFLRKELSNGEKELLLVVEKSVYEDSLWRNDSHSLKNSDPLYSSSQPRLATSNNSAMCNGTHGNIHDSDSNSKLCCDTKLHGQPINTLISS